MAAAEGSARGRHAVAAMCTQLSKASSSVLPILVFLLTVLCSSQLQAEESSKVIYPWEDLAEGFGASFTWPTLLFHASAVALTPPLVYTVDAPIQRYFQKHNPLGQTFADITLGIGWVSPVLVPLGLFVGGLAGDAGELATAGAAALQAVVVQAVIVSALKWLTDRKGPYPNGDPAQARWSKGVLRDSNDPKAFNFNPFDLSGGLRWPSGHTASNIALVSALVAFYPDQPWIAAVGYPAVLAIALGMIDGDYHWFSDVVAGALMGHAIGWMIGKHFRARYDAAVSGKAEVASFELMPYASPGGAGVTFVLNAGL